jgi:hypothetical protein
VSIPRLPPPRAKVQISHSNRLRRTETTGSRQQPGSTFAWYEQGTDGSECDWGRVLAWEPPHRLVVTWQINGQWQYDPDPAHATPTCEADVAWSGADYLGSPSRRSRAEVRGQALRPILISEIRGYQRVSPVPFCEVPRRKESQPVALGSQNQGRLHPLGVLTAHQLRWKVAQCLQHALGGAGRELPDHPASKSIADLHGAILP